MNKNKVIHEQIPHHNVEVVNDKIVVNNKPAILT